MKSGLEDRNNARRVGDVERKQRCLNEVRPGRPEQFEFSLPMDKGS